MRLVVFTLAAISLLIAVACLLRERALSERITFLERQLAEAPPRVHVIRVEEPSLTAVVTPPPAPTPKPTRKPTRMARTQTKQHVDLPKCPETDPTCGALLPR